MNEALCKYILTHLRQAKFELETANKMMTDSVRQEVIDEIEQSISNLIKRQQKERSND